MLKVSRFFASLVPLNASHLAYFQSILPQRCLQTTDLDGFNEDWLQEHKGNSALVLKPYTSEQVSLILSYCNQERLGIVPQSGNTCLTGGAVPISNELILSMRNMNKIIKMDETQGIVWTEAGVVLDQLNSFCAEKNWIVPLDLGSKGSCLIGGNVATNAGGVRLLRYGSLHGNVLGLEVVLPNGEVLCDLKGLRKDNTGYDYKQLFIGSEGSLGVITKVALLLAPKPKSVNTAFLACHSFESVNKILKIAKDHLGEILSAYEFLDQVIFTIILKHISNTRDPFSQNHPFYVLVETSGSNSEHDLEKFNLFLEECFHQQVITDGVVAQDSVQASNFWRIRENSAVATEKFAKHVFKFDVSLKLHEMYKLVENIREKVNDLGTVFGYGHVGDGNLHLTVGSNDDRETVKKIIFPFIYEEVQRFGGSISAEHGIGLFKRGMIKYSKDQNSIEYMVKNI